MLGIRERNKYGEKSYADLKKFIRKKSASAKVKVKIFQSNDEGKIIDEIQRAYGCRDGIVINAGGYSHTSVAILDALKAVGLPVVEVHLTDIYAREEYRRRSYVSEVASKTIVGKGFDGYAEAIDAVIEIVNSKADIKI